MCVSLCVNNLCAGACGGKKRAPYALNLELNVVMSSLTCMLGAKLRALERTASSLNHSTISQTKDIKILFLPPPNLNILGDQEKDKALPCSLMISGRKKIKNSSNKFSSQEVCDFFFWFIFGITPLPPTSEMRTEPTLGLHSEPRVLKAFYQRARSTIPES